MERLLELLFPSKCLLCRRVLTGQELDLCHGCRTGAPEFSGKRKKLRFVTEHTAVWFYEGAVRDSILRYKFQNSRSYAAGFGRLTAMAALKDLPRPDAVTWVPVSARRRRQRGYDQVELLARAVAEELGIPAVPMLKKTLDNRPNSSLETAEARRANVLGVYRPVHTEEIGGRRILLLDDIITTGATVSECARVLLGAGAKEVYAAAVAAVRNQK